MATNVLFLRNLSCFGEAKTFVELKMRQTNLSFGEAQLLCNLQTFCFSETSFGMCMIFMVTNVLFLRNLSDECV